MTRNALAVALFTLAGSGQAAPGNAPPCTPAGSDVCKVMSSEPFVATYRKAAGDPVQADDVVDLLTITLHDAAVGRFHAGEAAMGRQVETALDRWLLRVQRICQDPRATERAPQAIAEHLAEAGRSLNATITATDLGTMTGTVVALVNARGLKCLCAARTLSDLSSTCSPKRSP